MSIRLLNLFLILASMIGYLEWGTDHHGFLFQLEWIVIRTLFSDPWAAAHPFTLIPLAGQIVLFITLFQPVAGRVLTIMGLCALSLLLLLVFFIGLISLNIKIAGSVVPFLIVAGYTVRALRKS